MSALAFLRSNKIILLAAVLALFVSSARAHINLDDPNGGEQLEVGSVFTITWHILIAHNQQNWDLWYSTTGATGPWTTIAMNLPPGSTAVGSVHTYDWTIPDDPDKSVWVRVRMDNSGTDYFDVSNAPFSIIARPPPPITADISGPLGPGFPDGCIDAFDLGTLLGAWCSSASDPDPPGDLDPPCEGCTSPNFALADISGPVGGAPDGCVDAFDLAKLLSEWCSVAGGNPCGTCFSPP